jgi:glycosyltransferase involved in cell wall biosynthesis
MSGMADRTGGLTSVVVPCFNRLESTRRCVASLARHTRPPWELVAVDGGSTDGTAAYLQGIRDTAPFPVTVVPSPPDHGLPAACDRGFEAARGDYIVLLAHDAVVTNAWLEQLIALANRDPAVGAVAPMSNAADPPLRVADALYAGGDDLDRFAAGWRAARLGQWFTHETLSGPCLLAKRRALAGASNPGDPGDPAAALAARVRRAGFSLAVAHDLFVHAGPWPTAVAAAPAGPPPPGQTHLVTLSLAEFAHRYGELDTSRALCGYTPAEDTHAVLTLLAHARPRRVLEIGTAFGHMTANLTEWSPDDARVVSLGTVRGMNLGSTPEQAGEAPEPGDLGRLTGHFGKAHKAKVIAADTRGFDFARLAPLDLAFIDGDHGLDQVLYDSRAVYAALAPGGWLVWHDVGHPAPWVRVREAIEQAGFAETVEHVEGTMVAFLRKRGEGAAVGVRAGTEPLRLMWEGDIDGLHSLGLINRALCRALLGRGVDLGLADDETAEIIPERLTPDPGLDTRRGKRPDGGPPHAWVAHRWPPRLEPPPEGRWAFFQPWEYGSLPRTWLPAATRADEVWAYSRAVRDVYLDAGVPADRVHVVPLGVDPDLFRTGCAPLSLAPGPGFRFLFVGGTIWRKGADLLLAAYERAFRPGDGVGLVVQDMGTRSFYLGQTAGAAVAALRDRGYPVEYREEPLPPGELARLYAACDAAVQPYRGEGFALPVAEAMACGLPVIVTGAGPVLDYATDETAYLVPARRLDLPESRVGDIETAGRPWVWEPDLDALVDAMKRVASDPAAARSRGEAAARRVRDGFTWGHAAAAVEARLRVLADRADASSSATQVVPTPSPASATGRPKVSLTMIVRDEEHNLPACLESVRGLFDETVVIDTGSKDRTAEVACSFGARVCDFVWVGDFAAARNAALARATGDYAFWLDADDVLDPLQRESLRLLLDSLRHGDEAAYVVRCACDPDREGGGGETVVDHVRLFPLREDIRWTYRVHEQILPALRRAGVPVRWTDVTVRHTGYTDVALRRRKLARDEAILREELEDRPGDPFVLFNLGSIAIEWQDWHAALGHLKGSLAGSAPSDSITRKLFALIARSHQMLGEAEKALAACAAGLRIDPDDAELLFREAVIRRHGGDRDGAERCWRRVLTLKRPERFASVDQGIYGHLTRRNLAALAEERGDTTAALRHWEEVLSECPGDPEAARAVRRLREQAEGGDASR